MVINLVSLEAHGKQQQTWKSILLFLAWLQSFPSRGSNLSSYFQKITMTRRVSLDSVPPNKHFTMSFLDLCQLQNNQEFSKEGLTTWVGLAPFFWVKDEGRLSRSFLQKDLTRWYLLISTVIVLIFPWLFKETLWAFSFINSGGQTRSQRPLIALTCCGIKKLLEHLAQKRVSLPQRQNDLFLPSYLVCIGNMLILQNKYTWPFFH